jgi:hypothetical protein
VVDAADDGDQRGRHQRDDAVRRLGLEHDYVERLVLCLLAPPERYLSHDHPPDPVMAEDDP